MQRQSAPKILILENQMIIAADVALQLSKLGYKVIGINTCTKDALKTIEAYRPNIVVMNIEFEGNAKGLKTARTILDTFQTPVVFISANTDKEIFKGVIAAQAYAFITKPFDKKDLRRGIETALNRIAAEGLLNKIFNPF